MDSLELNQSIGDHCKNNGGCLRMYLYFEGTFYLAQTAIY
jgi:hypothetical protein